MRDYLTSPRDQGRVFPSQRPEFANRYVAFTGDAKEIGEFHDQIEYGFLVGSALLLLDVELAASTVAARDPIDSTRRRTSESTERLVLRGRLVEDRIPHSGPYPLKLDTTASRFHPASIAGIVVGVMGCFIFGLYLRGWMRERRAAA